MGMIEYTLAVRFRETNPWRDRVKLHDEAASAIGILLGDRHATSIVIRDPNLPLDFEDQGTPDLT